MVSARYMVNQSRNDLWLRKSNYRYLLLFGTSVKLEATPYRKILMLNYLPTIRDASIHFLSRPHSYKNTTSMLKSIFLVLVATSVLPSFANEHQAIVGHEFLLDRRLPTCKIFITVGRYVTDGLINHQGSIEKIKITEFKDDQFTAYVSGQVTQFPRLSILSELLLRAARREPHSISDDCAAFHSDAELQEFNERKAKVFQDSLNQQIAASKKLKEQEIERQRMQRLPGVSIGMSPEQVTNRTKWGKPISVNRTTTRSGVREQWVYGDGNYLYFENSRLVAIQN